MKCPKCSGTGYVYNNLVGYSEDCRRCHGKGEVQTNKEWFDALPTRKKAEFLSGMCVAAVRDFEWSETKRCCIDYWERWLKEEHK